MQKDNSIPSAGTNADSEQKVENTFASSHDTKPNVVGLPSLSVDVSALDGLNIQNKKSLIRSIQNGRPSFNEIVNTIFSKSNKFKCY